LSSFDEKTKFLILGDSSLDRIIDTYVDSDQYRSYKKYIDVGLIKDIREILIPELNKLFEDKNVDFDPDKSTIKVVRDISFSKHLLNSAKVGLLQSNATNVINNPDGSLGFKIADKQLNAFTLIELPYMERSGILLKDGKSYVVINSLTLEDALTFDGSKLKFVDSNNSLLFSGTVKPKVTMFNSSVSMIDFVVMLAKDMYGNDEGISYAEKFIYSLRNPSLISSIAGTDEDHKIMGEDAFAFSVSQLTGAVNDQKAIEFMLAEKIEEGYLNTTTTRRTLNEMLSFKNAIGRTISRDIVTNDGKTVVQEGEKVTELTVVKLNSNFIDTIHVRKSMNMVGQYVASPIFLGDRIVKGTPVIPQMLSILPNLVNYAVVPETYVLTQDQVLIIAKDTVITQELCDCLEYLGVEYLQYKERLTSKKILRAYFEEEYINNRHFPITDINLDNPEEYDGYVFVDRHGNIQEEKEKLTCHDIAAITSLYMKLLAGEHHELLSDPDAGLRKRVDQSYDHFHKAFVYATNQLIRRRGASLKRVATNKEFDNSDKMNTEFKFFGKDFWRCLQSILKVIDVLSTTNPVATISSLTKINTVVKNDDSIADSMRRLTMGHYGRICPYETPQSKKLGVVNNMAIGCIIEDGVMYTTYYKLEHSGGKTIISDTPTRMTVIQEERFRIADISDLRINYQTNEVFAEGKLPCRVPSYNSLEKTTFASVALEDVQYVSVSPNQHQSVACTTVPFAGSDDAARLSFGMAMVKQAKGLVNGEVPLICTTGFMNIPNMNTYYKIFAEKDGRVDVVNAKLIVVRYDGDTQPTMYEFDQMTISSASTIVRVAEVVVGERVVKGQTLVSSNYVKDGIMAIGVNAIVAYMTDGYNYEDGVPSSKRLCDKLTSYGVHTDTFPISKNTLRATVQGMRYEDYLSKDDKMAVISKRIVKTDNYMPEPIRAHKCRGFLARYDMVHNSSDFNKLKEIKVRSVSFDELNESDKICNRHGNKGVTCKTHENSDMPYFENGEFIDVKYNPNGIVSRMNIGQTHEATLGLACYVLGVKILCDSFNSPSTEDIKMLMSYTVDLANSEDDESIYSMYPGLPKELHNHCRNNIRRIRHWKGTFNKEGQAYLIDPKSGKRSLTRVNVGVNYIYKLVQEGESKLHSRGGFLTSPYVSKTESPTKGASNGGGQRMGYMELDALAAYGAEELLREITNERGDNYIARNNLTVKTLHSGDPTYMLDERNGIRRSTEYMFELLKSLGTHIEATEGELNLTDLDKRKYYRIKSLLNATFEGDVEEEDAESKIIDSFKNLRNKS
jgi:DNA-directed RNA polymerase beta subunit